MALKAQEEYVLALPDRIKHSMHLYTREGESYMRINEAFRHQSFLDREDDREVIHDLMEAFDRVPLSTSVLHTYKGIEREYVQTSPSFISACLTREVYKRVGSHCCILSLTIPPGSKVLPMYVISNERPGEEVLLPPEGSYQVTNVQIVDQIKTYDVTWLSSEAFCIW